MGRINHHPGCVARAKAGPKLMPEPVPTIAPTTAIPIVEPTWRLEEAIAPATPACSGGIPEIAVLVIGGLASPSPVPKIT